MVAKGHCIVLHLAHGGIDGFSGEEVGYAGALVDVSAVKQQEAALVVVLTVSANILYLVCNVCHPVMYRAVVVCGDNVTVDVRSLKYGEGIEAFLKLDGGFFCRNFGFCAGDGKQGRKV